LTEPVDITKASIVELKALAYDEFVNLQVIQRKIEIINQELSKREKDGV